ncbi:hypothetical protein FHG87_007551 [Trinorchestia longiramus]|nr:hypothetical protein FHG87_007551 [Trinorchestia longiramus]
MNKNVVWIVLLGLAEICCAWFRFIGWTNLVLTSAVCGLALLLKAASKYIYDKSHAEEISCRIIEILTLTFCSAPDRTESNKRFIAYDGKIFVETGETTDLDPQNILVFERF